MHLTQHSLNIIYFTLLCRHYALGELASFVSRLCGKLLPALPVGTPPCICPRGMPDQEKEAHALPFVILVEICTQGLHLEPDVCSRFLLPISVSHLCSPFLFLATGFYTFLKIDVQLSDVQTTMQTIDVQIVACTQRLTAPDSHLNSHLDS